MKAMSVPERIGAYISALDEVRVNRGSTLISVAPGPGTPQLGSFMAFVMWLNAMG